MTIINKPANFRKKDKVFYIAIFLMLFVCFFMVYEVDLLVKSTIQQEKTTSIIQQEKPLYERVIKRFAEVHNYNVTSYNCVNYSEDLGFILDNLGYNTTQIRHIPLGNGTHHRRLSINLEIEAQTGEIII